MEICCKFFNVADGGAAWYEFRHQETADARARRAHVDREGGMSLDRLLE